MSIQQNTRFQVIDKSFHYLLAFCYLSIVLHWGFVSFLLAWLFRHQQKISKQCIQAGLCQLPFIGILAVIDLASFVNGSVGLGSDSLWMVFFQGVLYWVMVVVFLLLSAESFLRGGFCLPYIYCWGEKIYDFFQNITQRRAVCLNLLCPGLGNLGARQFYVGWVLLCAFLLTAGIVFFVLVSRYELSWAMNGLNTLRFVLRLDDDVFHALVHNNLFVLGVLSVFVSIYVLSNLLIVCSFHTLTRNFCGGIITSYLLHVILACVLLMVPVSLVVKQDLSQISERAKEIYEELLSNMQKDQETPKISVEEREIVFEFDRTVTENIEELNRFQDKPYASGAEKTQPQIGYSDNKEINTDQILHVEESRQTKSYSEYLTAKIREDSRDQAIWNNSQDKTYAMVVEYIIEKDGRISQINIVESSNDLETDAIVLAVIESMNPLARPPKQQTLKVVELFWNRDTERFNSPLKELLRSYPDGRIIQVVP